MENTFWIGLYPGLSKEQLHQIVELEHALEIYWNGKKATNTLRYVTHHYSIFEFL
jgi:hypothetical protein